MRNIRITKKKGTEHSFKSQKNMLSKIYGQETFSNINKNLEEKFKRSDFIYLLIYMNN